MLIDMNKNIVTCVSCRSILDFDTSNIKHVSINEELENITFDDELKRCPHCNTDKLTLIAKKIEA
jgi:uncharacterized protein with PIN domain